MMEFSATISEDGAYRYRLARRWSSEPAVLWIMLNPSTADATTDDRTIGRVVEFSKRFGFGKAMVGNVFALRATDPRALLTHPAPVGGLNRWNLIDMAAEAKTVICAWGGHKMVTPERARSTLVGIRSEVIFCLGRTKSGAPRHPLYLPGDTKLETL